MLGIRLPQEAEEMLERHARSIGRGKSVVAREWILERLERESIDADMRRAAEHLAGKASDEDRAWFEAMQDAVLRHLDEEDGGYDWGDRGPRA